MRILNTAHLQYNLHSTVQIQSIVNKIQKQSTVQSTIYSPHRNISGGLIQFRTIRL